LVDFITKVIETVYSVSNIMGASWAILYEIEMKQFVTLQIVSLIIPHLCLFSLFI